MKQKILKSSSLNLYTLAFFAVACSILLLSSCKKETGFTRTNITANSADDELELVAAGDTTKLSSRPGLSKGQDSYVNTINGYLTENNFDWVNTIVMKAELFEGTSPIIFSSYIKFDDLNLIPATAEILNAKLELFGTDSLNTYYPEGNSYYPGSNTKPNVCVIHRVTGGNWDEHTITAANAPAFTTADEVEIKKSASRYNYNIAADVTALVKEMVAQGENYGFQLQLKTEVAYRIMLFNTSESVDKSKRPRLTVFYK